jgi:hypothetical protein
MVEKPEEKKDHHVLGYISAYTLGVVTVALILVMANYASLSTPSVRLSPPMNGVFYGQAIDALSLDPIPDVTLHFCSRQLQNDELLGTALVATVFSNDSGYYATTNITLPYVFYLSGEASGYYTQPLQETTAAYLGNQTYSVQLLRLYRISRSYGICVHINPQTDSNHPDGFDFGQNDNVTVILPSNKMMFTFDVTAINRDYETAAGSPYFGTVLHAFVEPSGAVITSDAVPMDSLIDAMGGNNIESVGLGITFPPPNNGTCQVFLSFQEKQYPYGYNTEIHVAAYMSFYVYVNVQVE